MTVDFACEFPSKGVAVFLVPSKVQTGPSGDTSADMSNRHAEYQPRRKKIKDGCDRRTAATSTWLGGPSLHYLHLQLHRGSPSPSTQAAAEL